MYGLAHTPPQPRVRLPSLEPYNPLSGTVGVSPGRRRRRAQLEYAPSSTSSHSDMSPVDRLDALTAQILQVLRAYAGTPMHSLVYLAQLKDYYRKALEINPNANPDDTAETAESGEPGEPGCQPLAPPSPTSSRTGLIGLPAINPHVKPDEASCGVSPPGPSPGKGRAGRLVKTIIHRRDSSGRIVQPNSADVDKLEKEWWSSEVVAAWYGPRPGSRTVGERTKSKRENERDVTLKRDASFVGLYDE